MNDYAPVLITTLNRHVHFKRCVESLMSCNHADETDLFIFLDYPLKDSHWEGYRYIKSYLPNINGFKTVNIIEREKNYGAVDNLFDSLDYIFERYDKVIISEDDNEFSSNFIDYINLGLRKYKYNEKVYSISGYNYPIRMPKLYNHDIYFYKGFSAWGVGIWKHKEKMINYSIDELKEYLKNPKNSDQIKKYSDLTYSLLLNTILTGEIYCDAMIAYNLIKNNIYSVFPSISKVRNHGNDGSGIHSGTNKIFCKQKIDDGSTKILFPNEINENNKINKRINNFFSRKFIHRLIRKYRKITR